MNKPPLITPDLILRDFTAQDLPAYRALRSDVKFQRFSSEEESTDAKAAELLQLFIEQSRAAIRLCRMLGFGFVEERPDARTFRERSWNTVVYAIRRHSGSPANLAFTSAAGKRR